MLTVPTDYYDLSENALNYLNNGQINAFIDKLITQYHNYDSKLYRVLRHNKYDLFEFFLKKNQQDLIIKILNCLTGPHRESVVCFSNYKHLQAFITAYSDSEKDRERIIFPFLTSLLALENAKEHKVTSLSEFYEKTLAELGYSGLKLEQAPKLNMSQ